MIISNVQQRSSVSFPEFTGERVYMREFSLDQGLPADLRRWQPTVDSMLDGVKATGPVFIMIDQAVVVASNPHRRPGLHVDGYWHPVKLGHVGHGDIW